MKDINPRVDIVFKKLFGVEENKDLLISLINSIVSAKDQVVDITLLNPYNLPEYRDGHWSIVDIKAKSADGKWFDIEIQITPEWYYDRRALYYWSALYAGQLHKKERSYKALSKVIGIHIFNSNVIAETDEYHCMFNIMENKLGLLPYFQDLEFHTLELPKFSGDPNAELSDIVAKVRTSLDRWMAFLTRHDLLDRESLPPALDDPALKKALNVLDVMHLGHEEREAYEAHLKWIRAEAEALDWSKQEGKKEGKEEGKQEGLEEGLEKGKKVTQENIARTMLAEGMSMKLISKITGLSTQAIRALK